MIKPSRCKSLVSSVKFRLDDEKEVNSDVEENYNHCVSGFDSSHQ
jgi:hypothetical protein